MKGFQRSYNRSALFFAAFLIGLLVKYNTIILRVFAVWSAGGVLTRNLVMIIVAIVLIRPLIARRGGRIGVLAFAAVYTGVFFANFWYNRYFGNYLSIAELTTGEGYNPTGVILRHIMRPTDLLYLADVVIMSVTLGWKRQHAVFGAGMNTREKIRRAKTAAIALLTAALILVSQVFISNLRFGGMRPLELYHESTPAFVSVYGFLPLYVAELVARDGGVPVADVPEQPEPLAPGELSGKPLVDDRSNVIVVQVESLDKKLIDYRHNGREVTPFVNSLKERSLYGTNFYAQHVNGSFDADFSLLTGLYPVNRHYSFRENDMTQFPSLVEILNDAGYETIALHGNVGEFFYRHQAYPELGFDRFYSRPDFDESRKRYYIEGGYLGINDYDFLYQSVELIEQAEEPFFAYLITVTSHTPFSFYPAEYTIPEFESLSRPLVRDFFNSIYFVDRSLEMFFNALERRGLTENTLFVIYSDHESAIDTPEYSSSVNFVVHRNVKEPEHIPLIIKHPDLEPGLIEKTGTITDLAPTILDFLGFPERPPEFAGFSLLEPEEAPVLFIHELPQVLYRNQLFVAELGELNRIGYIENRQADVVLSPEAQNGVIETIRYHREIMNARRRHAD